MKPLLLLLFVSVITCNLNTTAQSSKQDKALTPYEQKLYEIYIKLLKDVGFDYTIIQKARTDYQYAYSLKPMIKKKFEGMNSLTVIGITNQLQRDEEDAKSLMNASEREADRLERLKAEKIKQDSERVEEYMSSDHYKLKNRIKAQYTAWILKGEFEKSEEYEKRMNNKHHAARFLIFKTIGEYTKYMNSVGSSNGDMFKIDCSVGEYNADTEALALTFKNRKGVQWAGYIKLSPDKAKQVKSGLRTAYVDGVQTQFTDALQVTQDKCSLGFYKNNLLSTKIIIRLKVRDGKGNKHYEYPELVITSENKEIDMGGSFFTAANLEIDMKGNENMTFADVNLYCKENVEKDGK